MATAHTTLPDLAGPSRDLIVESILQPDVAEAMHALAQRRATVEAIAS